MKLIPREYFVAFAFALILIGTDDALHSCSHRDFTPNLTFGFAFVIQKVINLEIMLFRFALISVSMVNIFNEEKSAINLSNLGKFCRQI